MSHVSTPVQPALRDERASFPPGEGNRGHSLFHQTQGCALGGDLRAGGVDGARRVQRACRDSPVFRGRGGPRGRAVEAQEEEETGCSSTWTPGTAIPIRRAPTISLTWSIARVESSRRAARRRGAQAYVTSATLLLPTSAWDTNSRKGVAATAAQGHDHSRQPQSHGHPPNVSHRATLACLTLSVNKTSAYGVEGGVACHWFYGYARKAGVDSRPGEDSLLRGRKGRAIVCIPDRRGTPAHQSGRGPGDPEVTEICRRRGRGTLAR